MGRSAVAIDLTETERAELERLKRGRKDWAGLSRRASVVLLAAEGKQNKEIASHLGCSEITAALWRKRFAAERLDGLHDEPGPGAPRKIADEAIADTVRLTLETLPEGATHWSLRSMARRTNYAPSTIHRIWQAFSLKPHRIETFKLSRDPLFVDKVRFIDVQNAEPKPFRWTKSADDILASIKRFCLATNEIMETSESGH